MGQWVPLMKVKEGPLLCPQGSAEVDIWVTVTATARPDTQDSCIQPTAELGIWLTEEEIIAERCKLTN
jgi:hypothetical protein